MLTTMSELRLIFAARQAMKARSRFGAWVCAQIWAFDRAKLVWYIYIYMFFFNIIFWFRPILILFFFTLSTTSVKKELIWGKTHDGERRRGPIRKLWTYTLAILSSCITGWAKRPASWTGNWRRERGDQGRVSALLLFFFGGPFI